MVVSLQWKGKKKESYMMECTHLLPFSGCVCASDALEQTLGFHSFSSTETAACANGHFSGLDSGARQHRYH